MWKGTGGNTIEVQEYMGYVVRAPIVCEQLAVRVTARDRFFLEDCHWVAQRGGEGDTPIVHGNNIRSTSRFDQGVSMLDSLQHEPGIERGTTYWVFIVNLPA